MNQTDLTHQQSEPRPTLRRSTRKAVTAAQQIIGDQATAIDQANVFAGPNPRMVGLVGAAVYVAIFVVTGINAVLVFLPVVHAIRQARNLVVADRGLALFRSSFFGRPTEILTTHAASDLTTGEGETWLGFVKVRLGGGHVWIRTKDRDRLLGASR